MEKHEIEHHEWLERTMNEAVAHKQDSMVLVHRLWVLAQELDAVALLLTSMDSEDGAWELLYDYGDMAPLLSAAHLARKIALKYHPST